MILPVAQLRGWGAKRKDLIRRGRNEIDEKYTVGPMMIISRRKGANGIVIKRRTFPSFPFSSNRLESFRFVSSHVASPRYFVSYHTLQLFSR